MLRLLVIVLAIGATAVWAEVPHTSSAVVVRRKPNAKARAVITLPATTSVTITGEAGGWLAITAHVRKRTVTGYIPRTAIAGPAEDVEAPEDSFTAPRSQEPRTTIDAVVVRARPGEKQAQIATLPAHTSVTVLGEHARWLRIRSGTTVGYVTRTTITGPAPATEVVTPPHVASPAVPGWGDAHRTRASSALLVYATAAARLYAEAAPTASLVGELRAGAALEVLDGKTTSGWVKVRDPDARVGWVARGEVGNGAAQAAIDAPAVTATARAAAPLRTRAAALAARIDVGLGYRMLGMDFSSSGDGLANYAADAAAAAGWLATDVVTRRARLVLAFDSRAVASYATPGLRYTGPTAPSGEIGFSTLEVDAGARVGLRVRDLFDVALRVGAHYGAFVTKDVENAGTLPRERLLGATLGTRVEISPPASRVTATVRFDALVLGDRRQTAGLEDGTSSTARAWWGSATARYRLGSRFALQGGLELGRATTTWSGMSVRHPGVTGARRVDTLQLVQLGLSLEL